MSVLAEKTVLAVDPGSSKCGVALVRRVEDGKLDILYRAVISREQILSAVDAAAAVEKFSLIIVGNGTRSRPVVQEIRDHIPSVGILVVDERDTSLDARARYWETNQRRGWRKLLPATLQTPPEPIDDFVAVILAERVLTD